MLVLGIESASDQCGCALVTDDGVIAETRLVLPRRHAEALAPQMRFVCEQAGVALGDVEVIAVDHGPGLYTGLRAGLATAKATAAALGIGVVQVCSLEALAFAAAPAIESSDIIISSLDARRGEVFWSAYLVGKNDMAEVISGKRKEIPGLTKDPAEKGFNSRMDFLVLPRVDTPSGQGEFMFHTDGLLNYSDGRFVGVGNAYTSPEDPKPDELLYPSPAAVALLGREKALAGKAVAPEQVDALYLREPDARPGAQGGSNQATGPSSPAAGAGPEEPTIP